MATVGVEPSAAVRDSNGNVTADVDRLPEEMNHMKIQDDKVFSLFYCGFHLLLLLFFC